MLGKIVNFKKAKKPLKINLIGKYVVLEPINPKKHIKDLYKCFSLDKKGTLWTYMSDGPFKNIKQLDSYLKNKDCYFYAIYSKKHKKYSGLVSYLRVNLKARSIEVGYITYSPIIQRTVQATETMYLMMKNAFENLNYRRYEWKCDNLNKKSKNAAFRLGFKFEGIFRQATISKRRNRDTAWFSIIDKEWKKLKKGYSNYLKLSNFDKNLKQLSKLKF